MERRTEIIVAVWSVILAKGIAGVSIRAVATAAGVSIGLVQHHFPTKEVLIRESAAAMIAGSTARFLATEADDEAAVRDLVVHAIPVSPGQRDGVVIWHAYLAGSVADPELAALLRDAKSGQERELADRLSTGRAVADAARLARTLIAVADGLSSRVIAGGLDGDEAVETALAAIDALTRGGLTRGWSVHPDAAQRT
ncbi:TetR/AcrR family transcriptional regulator [Agromyces sp. LHK192]|uniref:TetR/AcrR family transcriptional regulator n=1 Tax=Agromyces sp. LHK192 TaxID=2498704 RepID=UPI000FD84D3C|nr:TetR/AcrR family transcriptional regulator [Agromyces sp. LHK192]